MGDAKELVTEHLELILFFGSLSFFTHWAAWKNGFFFLKGDKESSLPSHSQIKEEGPTLKQLIIAYAIYLGVSLFLAPLLARSFIKERTPSLALVGYVQLLTLGLNLLLLSLFCFSQDRSQMKKIWKDTSRLGSKSVAYDFYIGFITWLISFPLIIFIGQVADLLLYLIFKVENYEQVAVRYLKMTLGIPFMLGVALFAILIAAPFIEEFLFRGFLQNWFKRYLGVRAAIVLASFAFAVFHLAFSQGFGNISLGLSLFALGCYLGFIYERQGSLFASISLHMTFNVVSTLRILIGGL
jgi:uncharacterized protein